MPTDTTPAVTGRDVPYLFDNATPEAARQVRLLAAILDPHTQDVLLNLDLDPAWTALELGAGAGTIAHFLAYEAGLGSVVAIDANPQHIESDERITVRREDVVNADLGDSRFGLIHARLLFMHLPQRERLLKRCVAALKPGGYLVISDWDCTRLDDMLLSASPQLREAFLAFQTALIAGGQRLGMDPAWARRIPAAMLTAGLSAVETVAHNQLWTGGQPGMHLHASNSRQLESALLAAGMTARQLDVLREGMEDPQVNGYSYLMYTAVARRPRRPPPRQQGEEAAVETALINGLDGLAYAMLLFIVGAGLTLIFGVLDVLNLAHGSLYLAGAYLASTVTGGGIGGFAVAVLAGVIAGAAGGTVLAGLLRPIRDGGHLEQALLTLGLAYIASWAFTAGFGATPRRADPPDVLAGSITLAGHGYPFYRLGFIAVAALVAVGLHLLVRRTAAGIVLRATVSDRGMAAVSGIRTDRVQTLALAAGGALAAASGVLGAPLLGPAPGVDTQVLMLSLIVVVLGGAGSVPHTLAAAVLVGEVQASTVTVPAVAPFLLFAAVLTVLVVRGGGGRAVSRA
jgi:branched-subunit amino acid ABC-type transport system permease component/precorrin-6B methylase 2